jgi:hypothetical protein
MPVRASLSCTMPVTVGVRMCGGKGVCRQKRTGLVLVEADFQRVVVDDAVHVAGQVVQDFERQVSERLLGALDPLAGVRLGERDTEIFAHSFGLALV